MTMSGRRQQWERQCGAESSGVQPPLKDRAVIQGSHTTALKQTNRKLGAHFSKSPSNKASWTQVPSPLARTLLKCLLQASGAYHRPPPRGPSDLTGLLLYVRGSMKANTFVSLTLYTRSHILTLVARRLHAATRCPCRTKPHSLRLPPVHHPNTAVAVTPLWRPSVPR